MNVVFIDIATYEHPLSGSHGQLHRARRLASDMVAEKVMQVPLSGGKIAFSRGMLLLASLVKAEGARVSYIHYNLESHYSLTRAFKKADIVCFYAMTPTVNTCLRLATIAKKINNRLSVAFGGPHTSTQAEPLLSSGVVDFVSYAETSPSLLARALLERASWKDCPGIGFREAEDMYLTQVNPPDNTKHEAFYPLDYSILPLPLDTYYFNISASQGCGYTCNFCSDGTRPLSLRSVDDFISEVRFLDTNLPAGSWVHFFDSIFTAPQSRAKVICERLASETHNLSFSCDIKANHLTEDLAKILKKARVRFISMGFETSDDLTLNVSDKKNSFDECYSTAQILKGAYENCALKAYWLFGLPGSTPAGAVSDLKHIEHLLDKGIVDIVGPKCFVPYPETIFHQTPERFGLKILSKNWDDYDRFHIPPVAIPDGFTQSMLADCLIKAEEIVLTKYCQRMNTTPDSLIKSELRPKRYNGELYSRIVP